MTPPRKAVAAKATAARVRRPTAAELATDGDVTPGVEVREELPSSGFDPELDFDLGAWREQKSQAAEATRETVKFRLDDRRPDAPGDTYVVDIPLLGKWPGRALRRLEGDTPSAYIESIAMATDDPELAAVMDELTGEEVRAVLEHVIRLTGVTPGESKPSGASSRSMRRR